MKKILFGSIYGIPAPALFILAALFAACGLQQLGVDPLAYKLVAGIGTLAGLALFVVGLLWEE